MIAAILVLAHASVVAAENVEALRLFDEGRALADAGDHAGACDRFARSFELDELPGTEGNLADCHEKLGRLPRAWRLFSNAARRWDRADKPAHAKAMRERAAVVARRLATVVIGVPDPGVDGLRITINDTPVAPAPEIREVFEPGTLEIVATAPGRAPFTRSREVAAGETTVVELVLAPPNDDDNKDDDDRSSRPVAASGRQTRVRVALGLGVTSATAGATALVLALYGKNRYDAAVAAHCEQLGPPPRGCDALGQSKISSAQTLTDVGTGFAIGAGTLAIAAVIVYVTAPRAVRITPVATASGTSLWVTGHF